MPHSRRWAAALTALVLPLVAGLSGPVTSSVAQAAVPQAPTAGAVHSAPPVILWPRTGAPAAARAAAGRRAPGGDTTNNLIFHGGAVEHHPKVYMIFWGSEWKTGFHIGPGNIYSDRTARAYETSFFAAVGGTKWHGTQSQFCDGAAPGAVSCADLPASSFVKNEAHVLKGVWVDPSPAPSLLVTTVGNLENAYTDAIAAEAVKASQHFRTTSIDANFMIFTPPGHAATAYGTVYCAFHSEVLPSTPGTHGIRYAFMPFTPEQGGGCGGESVNRSDDSFGHGYFDSYTLAGGHEFEEMVTDPDAYPAQDGWNDVQTNENGDKCAYFHAADLHIGRQFWAVQPMWSNEANNGTGGCAMSRGRGTAPVKGPAG